MLETDEGNNILIASVDMEPTCEPTATPTASETPGATATPTPTPTRALLYLPVLLK